jgi:hypothetical protein
VYAEEVDKILAADAAVSSRRGVRFEFAALDPIRYGLIRDLAVAGYVACGE